jgi:glycosyltransferase involved in cell wall biosynthesis
MLSVVVPTRNRADLLDAFLASLAAQTLGRRHWEVIVVDNGSTDETAAVVARHAAVAGNIRYAFEPSPGLHAGRHRGLVEAAGEILVYADDDIEPLPTWLQSMGEVFADESVAMAGGNDLPMFMTPPPAWLLRLWNRPHLDGGRALASLSILELSGGTRPFSPYRVWGCNFGIRKTVVLDAGGFHPDGMPRDLIRMRGDGEVHVARHVERRGMTCMFHPGASVRHKVTPERMTISYFRSRGYSQGISDSYTHLRGDAAEPTASQRTGLVARIARRLRRKWTDWRHLDAGARRALQAERDGYREGYAFHQQAYRDDPALRAWVHQAIYMDMDGAPA